MKSITENIMSIIAIVVIVSTIVYIFAITFIPVKATERDGLIALIGFSGSIISYYWGYSRGSAKKDEAINELSKKQ